MCVRPIQIYNPKIKGGSFHNNSDPLFITVPCGRCYECLLQKQQEWLCRNYYEYKHTLESGGIAFYYTLTWNEESILKINSLPSQFSNYRISKKSTPPGFSVLLRSYVRVFNPVKVKLFLKRLNARLARRGIDLKYFLVSELGKTTERPHHHVIFYLSKFIAPSVFYNLVNQSWSYGFIEPGDNFGIVNSVSALSYCCKYISKNGKKIGFKAVLPCFRSFVSSFNRHFGNFRRVSSGLGWNKYVILNKQDFIDGFILLPVDGKFKRFPIPLYYKRKLCQESFVNRHGNVVFRPNKFGWSIMEQQFWCLYDNLEKKCQMVNSLHGTDFSADEILHYRLRNSLPLSRLKFSDKSLFMQRKINNGSPGSSEYSVDDRYFCDAYTVNRNRLFNHLNALSSYEKYRENTRTYNIRQRVLYRKSPREIKTLNFAEYVSTYP